VPENRADGRIGGRAGGPGWRTRIDKAPREFVIVERAKRSVALDAEERAARAAAKTAAE
jgi:hypothetical protein